MWWRLHWRLVYFDATTLDFEDEHPADLPRRRAKITRMYKQKKGSGPYPNPTPSHSV